MVNSIIAVGDVVALAAQVEGSRLFRVVGAPGIPQGPMDRVMLKHENEPMGSVRLSEVKHHWKPAKATRGPLKGPRKRDELVITQVEVKLCRPNPRARLKATARVLVSDQLWIDGFAIFDNMEVQTPEGVRLTIPTGKTWIKWRSAIVEAYFKATEVQK